MGVIAGGVISNSVPERAIEVAFAAFQVYLAYKLLRVRKAKAEPEPEAAT